MRLAAAPLRVAPAQLCQLAPLLLLATPRPRHRAAAPVSCAQPSERVATLRFQQDGPPEEVVPTVALTRSRDRSTGTATFRFERPSVLRLNAVWEDGLITGLWVCDSEGCLSTRDLKVTFQQGRPWYLTAVLVLKSADEWQRFLRFMRLYAREHDLSFESAEVG